MAVISCLISLCRVYSCVHIISEEISFQNSHFRFVCNVVSVCVSIKCQKQPLKSPPLSFFPILFIFLFLFSSLSLKHNFLVANKATAFVSLQFPANTVSMQSLSSMAAIERPHSSNYYKIHSTMTAIESKKMSMYCYY